MKYENGIYTIPCKVNGVPMKFIFDTGASDVSISLTEAKFLIKQGLLSDKDVKGKVKYKIANGDIEEGTKIILKEINIDGFLLKNVEASIVHQLNAPLLLGQSAISKLGTFELDGNKLIIKSNKENKYDFLGIDLSKDIEDFGLSRVNLENAKPIISIDFNDLKIDKNHFLKDFEFDKQKVVFGKDGNIAMIVLQKIFSGNNYEKENKSKETYKSLINILDSNFWVTKTKKTRNSSWKSKNLELLLNIDNDKSINIVYVPKILKNINSRLLNNDSKNLKPIDKSNNKKLNDLRLGTEKIVTETLENQSSTNKRQFARILNNNFEFHNEIKIAYDGSKKETGKLNEMISYYLMLQFISSNEMKELFVDCNFDNLIFKIQVTNKNYEKTNSERKISGKNLEKLNVPFSEKEILDILEK
ncbi:TIGR02281 family clan AA aspartic protease [Polaribacter sp. 11A2H]|uniref:retropepsin-like aspartic protease family protein n=1 Tax=Polaribacter sp. 11A2H TaxID=2687290 RepID=UPI00140DB14B|nr:retropepsin-like aspartic protease [Polaribacter sp. 11A2H]